MTWTVQKLGTGSASYDDVRVIEGGALECSNNVKQGLWANAEPQVVAFYGPGMWVRAEKSEQ